MVEHSWLFCISFAMKAVSTGKIRLFLLQASERIEHGWTSSIAKWQALLDSYELSPELHMARVLQLGQANGPKMPSGQSLDERTCAVKRLLDFGTSRMSSSRYGIISLMTRSRRWSTVGTCCFLVI